LALERFAHVLLAWVAGLTEEPTAAVQAPGDIAVVPAHHIRVAELIAAGSSACSRAFDARRIVISGTAP
jgi:hypothetical protein